ncbi:ankyrin repeat domain-containing protein [Maribius pontilimi]|uniref:Ankyrin repeat domain-containing protein n=1 Tax=Palleronia pontilimi TaxID=1964209 RepID=A0A934IKV1_9RHOB|nr:ankyrin repeat domain-containing protein [Palleronia pontilimi]MBJ3763859.1 ankyrin repeat domain-containing protein [Palleronia pontilimi]
MRNVHAQRGQALKEDPPDIFKAARDNDILELRMAIEDGQSLQTTQIATGFTPVHVAAMRGSVTFIKVAMELDPDTSWMQDIALRTPFDHAAARRDREAMKYLHLAMYPGV